MGPCTFYLNQKNPKVSLLVSFLTTGLSPVGASVPGTSQWTAWDQGGEREAEADEWRVSTGAGAHQPRADLGSGAAECAAGAVHTASWGEGDVSCRHSYLLRLLNNSSPYYLASLFIVSCLLVRMQSRFFAANKQRQPDTYFIHNLYCQRARTEMSLCYKLVSVVIEM